MKGFKKGEFMMVLSVKQGDIIGLCRILRVDLQGLILHYEIIQNGEQMNPAKLKLPSGRKLNEKEIRINSKNLIASYETKNLMS